MVRYRKSKNDNYLYPMNQLTFCLEAGPAKFNVLIDGKYHAG